MHPRDTITEARKETKKDSERERVRESGRERKREREQKHRARRARQTKYKMVSWCRLTIKRKQRAEVLSCGNSFLIM